MSAAWQLNSMHTPVVATSSISTRTRRRAWTNWEQRTSGPQYTGHVQLNPCCHWHGQHCTLKSYAPRLTATSEGINAAAEPLPLGAKLLLQSVSRKDPADKWLQHAVQLSTQELLQLACTCYDLSAQKFEQQLYTLAVDTNELFAAKQFLLIMENREGSFNDLHVDTNTLTQLCSLLHALNTLKVGSLLQYAENIAGARLRWHNLYAWINEEVLQPHIQLDSQQCAIVLQAFVSAAYPAATQTLVVLTNGLSSPPPAHQEQQHFDIQTAQQTSRQVPTRAALLQGVTSLQNIMVKRGDAEQLQAVLQGAQLHHATTHDPPQDAQGPAQQYDSGAQEETLIADICKAANTAQGFSQQGMAMQESYALDPALKHASTCLNLLTTCCTQANQAMVLQHNLQQPLTLLLEHSTAMSPWLSCSQLIKLLQITAQLAPILFNTQLGKSPTGLLASLLQASSIALWSMLDHLSFSHICDAMFYYGQLQYRNGLLLEAMIDKVWHAVTSQSSGSSRPADHSSTDLNQQEHHVSANDLVRFCWGMAYLKQEGKNVSDILASCTTQLLTPVNHQTGDASLQQFASMPSLTESSWDSQQQELARQQEQGTDSTQSAAHLDRLVTMLWCYGVIGVSRTDCMQALRALVSAIIAHDHGCTTRQLGIIWQSAARLSLSGVRLCSWLMDSTTRQLQHVMSAMNSIRKSQSLPIQSGASLADSVQRMEAALQHQANRLVPASSLAKVCYGMQKLGQVPRPVLHNLLVEATLLQAHSMQPDDLVQTVYALAHALKPTPVNNISPVTSSGSTADNNLRELLSVAATKLDDPQASMQVTNAAHLVWVLAKSGQRINKAALQRIEEQLVCSPACMVTRNRSTQKQKLAQNTSRREAEAMAMTQDTLISQFLWASSTCGHRPLQLATAYANALPTRLDKNYHGGRDANDSAAMVAAAVFGLGACKHRASHQLLSFLERAMDRYHQFFTGHQFSMILYGFAQLGHCPKTCLSQGWFLKQLRVVAKTMSLQELVNTLWALGQWPLDKVLKSQWLDHIRSTIRPVLLVNVLGAQHAAAVSYDAAGEPTEQQQPSQTSIPPLSAIEDPGRQPTSRLPTPGVPFGRLPSSFNASQAALSLARPPLSASSIANLLVGMACVEVSTPGIAEDVAMWALSPAAGGLARFSNRQLSSMLWAFASCKHDRLSLFEGAAEVLVDRFSRAKNNSNSDASQRQRSNILGTRDLQKLLWAWSKLNRHPGEEFLDMIRQSWQRATGTHPAPIDELCSTMYSLAILREHRHPLMTLLASQLLNRLQQDGLSSTTQSSQTSVREEVTARAEQQQNNKPVSLAVMQQAPQLAACLLAAAAEQQESPLVQCLPPELRMKILESWHQKAAKHAQRTTRKPNRYLKDLQVVAKNMDLLHRVELTPDGLVCPDLTVGLSFAPNLKFALELVGPHNAAVNSQRLLGDAALKYRLLQARGYLVIPISCQEWDKLDRYKEAKMTNKISYVNDKIEQRLAAITGIAQPPKPTNDNIRAPATTTSTGLQTPSFPSQVPEAKSEPRSDAEKPDVTIRAPPSHIKPNPYPPNAPQLPQWPTPQSS